MKTFALALASLPLFAASIASAQPAATPTPAPAPAAEPAPQTDSWNDVSHINGTVVPVGEHGEYLYKNPKVNISTNPVSWLFGLYGVSASYAVGNNVAIRGDINVLSRDSGNYTGYEAGLSAPIYLKRVYRGPFIEPGVIVQGQSHENVCYDASGGASGCTNSETFVGPEMLVGWHFSFDSGLNAAIAVGAAKNLEHSDSDYDSEEIIPEGYFRVGYEF